MTPEGANQRGSLAVVSAKLADGTEIRGVTFPRMFVQTQQQSDGSEVVIPELSPTAIDESPRP